MAQALLKNHRGQLETKAEPANREPAPQLPVPMVEPSPLSANGPDLRVIESSERDRYISFAGKLAETTVSVLMDVPLVQLRAKSRCRADIAFARQIAMYVSHVVLGLSMNDVGRGFGRDRTTVLHA